MDSADLPFHDSANIPSPSAALERALPAIAPWMTRQRWYVHAGSDTPQLRVVGAAELSSDGSAAAVFLSILEAQVETSRGTATTLYQLPILVGGAEARESGDDEDSLIGSLDDGTPVRDALRTDVGRRAVLRLVAGGSAQGESLSASGTWLDDADLSQMRATRILTGEQSNTSIIAERDGAAAVIAKVFRVIQNGHNPDVVIQESLQVSGNRRIAPLAGFVEGNLTGNESIQTHLVFAQHLLDGVEDAWRVALREATDGTDFRTGARDLGVATAEVHRDLATALPTHDTDDQAREAMMSQMRERLEQVSAEVPEVAKVKDSLLRIIEQARDLSWPPMQRIHGDYHLGQVLSTPTRGWVLLDFEGEPLRPLAQRSAPDSPLRDVAGMLRSFDYVAGSVKLTDDVDASAWATDARAAFWDGYTATLGLDPDDAALRALVAVFEADKAVYEALYEARQRPTWLPIPLAAISRIAGGN